MHPLEIASITESRMGEIRVGEKLIVPEAGSSFPKVLEEAKDDGARYVIIGVPEDIGVRANSGRPGARKAWEAFLAQFLKQQANRFFDPSKILLLGIIECDDLMKKAR